MLTTTSFDNTFCAAAKPLPKASLLERLTAKLPTADAADQIVGRVCCAGLILLIISLVVWG